MTKPQFDALCLTAKNIGSKTFYISIVEGEEDFLENGCLVQVDNPVLEALHWICDSPTFKEYQKLPLILENAIFSSDGRWGGLISHEDHAIFGGDERFVEYLRQAYPDWRSDVDEFRAMWPENPEWIKPIIESVLGVSDD